jgi:hypothetical protein
MSDYRWGLDWWFDLLYTLIQSMTTLVTHMLVFAVTSSQPLLNSGVNGRRSLSSGFPELSLCLTYQQQLTWTETQQPSNSLTHSFANSLHCTAPIELNSVGRVTEPLSRPHRKHRFQQYLKCCARAAAYQLLQYCYIFTKLLPTNGSCLVSRPLPSNRYICHSSNKEKNICKKYPEYTRAMSKNGLRRVKCKSEIKFT